MALLLIRGFALQAQTPKTGTLIERFIQHLTWEAVESAYYYEVVVEWLDDSGAEVVREVTEAPFFDCSLFPGRYRYQVLVYNLLGRLASTSAWSEFEVLAALSKRMYAEENEEERFIQRLTWEPIALAYYYEAVVELQEDRRYREVLRRATQDPWVLCSLSPGHYRYRVLVYNLLGHLGATSAWSEFEILPAWKPDLIRFSPNHFYLDKDTKWVITVTGRNLREESKLYLKSPRDGATIVPINCTPTASGEQAHLTFDQRQLVPGAYDVVVENPGGFVQSLGTFRIANTSISVSIAAEYSPMLTLPVGYFNNSVFKPNIFPAGTHIRFGLIPFKGRSNAFGFELTPGWNYLAVKEQTNKGHTHILSGHLNVFFQQWLPNRIMAFTFRVGGGTFLIYDYYFESAGNPVFEEGFITTWIVSVGGGFSFQWFIRKPLFVELGAEFLYVFSIDNPPPAYIRPMLGLGWQF
jgi:hypothetical protein